MFRFQKLSDEAMANQAALDGHITNFMFDPICHGLER
jgi:hypothetical protein